MILQFLTAYAELVVAMAVSLNEARLIPPWLNLLVAAAVVVAILVLSWLHS